MLKTKTDQFLFVVLIIIFFGLLFFLWDYHQKKQYEECIKACEENNSCLKRDGGDKPFTSYNCLEWSKGECKNDCIKKYK